MKNVSHTLLAVALMAVTGLASAHTQSGALGSTTSGGAATDIYSVSCYNDGSGAPAKIWYHVKDLAPVLAPVISIQVESGGISSDTVDGDANYSTAVTVAGTSGNLKVMKSASTVKGSETYVAEFHCQTSNGTHTGTNWTMTQNQ
jgi:hypothetical protein